MRIYEWKPLGKRTSFWSDTGGGCGQLSGFPHPYNNERENRNKRRDGNVMLKSRMSIYISCATLTVRPDEGIYIYCVKGDGEMYAERRAGSHIIRLTEA